MSTLLPPDMSIASIHEAFQRGLDPIAWCQHLCDQLDAYPDKAVWISLLSRDAILKEVTDRLDDYTALQFNKFPLLGIPFFAKDNIDVAGLSTTAGCPDFAYQPTTDATVVALLRQAGAICLGKTNMDQFATGLVGTRSPFGIPQNPHNPAFIPGGSSSGSAVAVAAHLATFSLGTDTAGSGRVPAAFNGLVGWKPSRGLLSTKGVVPAVASLDCVSVFTRSVADAATIKQVVARYDQQDPWSRSFVSISDADDLNAGNSNIRDFSSVTSHPLLATNTADTICRLYKS